MLETQNETCLKAEGRSFSSFIPHPSALAKPSAFTLVELLVVITIIGILAGLITGAAIRALNKAKQAAISMEIQQLNGAIEDFKNEYVMYPPNVFSNSATLGNNNEKTANGRVLLRAIKRVSSRSTEFSTSPSNPWDDNITTIVERGLSPAEALVFWLQGFSSDIARPLSGTDLAATSIDFDGTTINNVITIDSRQPRYDFDRGRLRISRDSNGDRRFLIVQRPNDNTDYQIQLYEYLAPSSQEPYVYFDTSRETPLQVVNNWDTTEFSYTSKVSDGQIYPIKQLRTDAPAQADWVTPNLQYFEYVEKGKFQILHCGTDDAWGDFSNGATGLGGALDVTNSNSSGDIVPNLLFPTGPFIGDVADTVGNFMGGTLEDEQE